MIDIVLEKYPMRLKCTGHATGAGDQGQNLVCCAVSTLIYTLDEALDEAGIPFSDSIEEGYADITLSPRPAKMYVADIIFQTIITGLSCLAEQYPEYITLRKEYED
jgi:uncharacterized protein YsxB (DUF464 family)